MTCVSPSAFVNANLASGIFSRHPALELFSPDRLSLAAAVFESKILLHKGVALCNRLCCSSGRGVESNQIVECFIFLS